MSQVGLFPHTRLRRLRQHANIRNLVKETQLHLDHLVLPLFIKEGTNIKNPISTMPGHFQLSLDHLEDELSTIAALNIKNIILFGIPKQKDAIGSCAYTQDGIIQRLFLILRYFGLSLDIQRYWNFLI